jgi:hypothetical protein
VDTGGIVFQDDGVDVFLPQIREQALIALSESRAAVLVVDGRTGPTALDMDIANFLRKQKLPVLLAVNKCESHTQGELLAAEFWALGLGTPHPVSGIHGTGLAELLDELVPHLVSDESEKLKRVHCRVAIVGRPNVGKSSLLNRLSGQNRAIVSDVAGTTRDTIDSTVEFADKRCARAREPREEAGQRGVCSAGRGVHTETGVDGVLGAGRGRRCTAGGGHVRAWPGVASPRALALSAAVCPPHLHSALFCKAHTTTHHTQPHTDSERRAPRPSVRALSLTRLASLAPRPAPRRSPHPFASGTRSSTRRGSGERRA